MVLNLVSLRKRSKNGKERETDRALHSPAKGFHFSFDGFYNMEELNYMSYKIAAIEGIEYVLNNLI